MSEITREEMTEALNQLRGQRSRLIQTLAKPFDGQRAPQLIDDLLKYQAAIDSIKQAIADHNFRKEPSMGFYDSHQ